MRDWQALIEEGFQHHRDGRIEDAFAIYDRMLGFMGRPDPNLLYAFGTLLAGSEHYGLASYLLRHSAAVNPEHAPTLTNLAIALQRMERYDDALDAFNRALAIDPECPEVHTNLAGFWINKGHPEKVIEHARKALVGMPDNPHAHNHLALGLFESGDLSPEAWGHYEYRWQLPERIKDRRPYLCPRWDGARTGRLAIHGEQGLGDEILFLGCLEEAARRCDSVVVECNERLVDLVAQSFGVAAYPDHASLIAKEGEPDAYIPMGSLPGIVGVPSGDAYMVRRATPNAQRVGIAWRGGVSRTHKNARSIPLGQLCPILDESGPDFVSVQYGEWDHEAEAQGIRHISLGRDLRRAHDLIASCDLIITVTQTAVHQAGAMGIPCWVLVPFGCSWQFSPHWGDNMRWYRSVRLFRQEEGEDWAPVIERVREALHDYYR